MGPLFAKNVSPIYQEVILALACIQLTILAQ